MRNLKKILALVLALIMSLSLMATAGATDFKDDESIDTYQTAIEVLSGLKVFGGDQNGNFNPKDPIRRSEVAAIIYRIATGDVNNDHNASYGLYNQFKDVQDGDWFAGYVSYCHNAGYIKGHGDSTFAPYDNVTGYQALAMILRAVGYDKNNEFTGDNWQINTASIATQRGVLKGLQSTEDLKAAASRELVAEILFRSILLNKVEWNAITHQYYETDEKVCEVLKLEEIEGIVVANEWANLGDNDLKSLALGKTTMLVDGKNYNLDYSTVAKDLGRSRIAYVQNGSKVLYIGDTEKNDGSFDNEGAKTDISTAAKFSSASGLNYNNDTQWYVNFDLAYKYTSDWKISYALTKSGLTADQNEYFEKTYTTENYGKVSTRGTGVNAEWFIEIARGNEITNYDLGWIEKIFTNDDKTAAGYVRGEVYIATQSTEDASDKMPLSEFYTYLTTNEKKVVDGAKRGEWLQVVDNDDDGIAEYVFLTESNLDQVVRSVTRDDKTTRTYYNVPSNASFRYVEDGAIADNLDLDLDDKVLWTEIDGYYYMEKAGVQNGTVSAVNYDKESVTTEDGDLVQSRIVNQTRLDEEIVNVDRNVEYIFYLDHFGFARAYELAGGRQYTLLTEAYAKNNDATQYIRNFTGIVEHKIGDAAIQNSNVANFNANFVHGDNIFFNGTNSNTHVSPYNQLVVATKGLNTRGQANAIYLAVQNSPAGIAPTTNVANYTMDTDGNISIYTAALQATDRQGNPLWYEDVYTNGVKTSTNKVAYETNDGAVMARDYVLIDDTKAIAKGDSLYALADVSAGVQNGVSTNPIEYVHATHSTEYYLVLKGNTVRYFSDYTNMPKLDAAWIDTAYAVAQNYNADAENVTNEYWVADVVVIELNSQYVDAFEDIVLFTHNQSKSNETQYDLTGVSRNSRDQIIYSIDSRNWRSGQLTRPFFVGTTGGNSKARATDDLRNMTAITSDFAGHGIYAATIDTINADRRLGDYITLTNDGIEKQISNIENVPVYTLNANGAAAAYDLRETTKLRDVNVVDKYGNEGDQILYVKNGNTVAFIIMVTVRNADTGVRANSALAGLTNLWSTIAREQSSFDRTPNVTLVPSNGNAALQTLLNAEASEILEYNSATGAYTINITKLNALEVNDDDDAFGTVYDDVTAGTGAATNLYFFGGANGTSAKNCNGVITFTGNSQYATINNVTGPVTIIVPTVGASDVTNVNIAPSKDGHIDGTITAVSDKKFGQLAELTVTVQHVNDNVGVYGLNSNQYWIEKTTNPSGKEYKLYVIVPQTAPTFTVWAYEGTNYSVSATYGTPSWDVVPQSTTNIYAGLNGLKISLPASADVTKGNAVAVDTITMDGYSKVLRNGIDFTVTNDATGAATIAIKAVSTEGVQWSSIPINGNITVHSKLGVMTYDVTVDVGATGLTGAAANRVDETSVYKYLGTYKQNLVIQLNGTVPADGVTATGDNGKTYAVAANGTITIPAADMTGAIDLDLSANAGMTNLKLTATQANLFDSVKVFWGEGNTKSANGTVNTYGNEAEVKVPMNTALKVEVILKNNASAATINGGAATAESGSNIAWYIENVNLTGPAIYAVTANPLYTVSLGELNGVTVAGAGSDASVTEGADGKSWTVPAGQTVTLTFSGADVTAEALVLVSEGAVLKAGVNGDDSYQYTVTPASDVVINLDTAAKKEITIAGGATANSNTSGFDVEGATFEATIGTLDVSDKISAAASTNDAVITAYVGVDLSLEVGMESDWLMHKVTIDGEEEIIPVSGTVDDKYTVAVGEVAATTAVVLEAKEGRTVTVKAGTSDGATLTGVTAVYNTSDTLSAEDETIVVSESSGAYTFTVKDGAKVDITMEITPTAGQTIKSNTTDATAGATEITANADGDYPIANLNVSGSNATIFVFDVA